MGGSVAVHVAARKVIRNLAGLVVIDVVEVCFTFEAVCTNVDSFWLNANPVNFILNNREQPWHP